MTMEKNKGNHRPSELAIEAIGLVSGTLACLFFQRVLDLDCPESGDAV